MMQHAVSVRQRCLAWGGRSGRIVKKDGNREREWGTGDEVYSLILLHQRLSHNVQPRR